MARRVSEAPMRGTRAISMSVAGFITEKSAPESAPIHSPSTRAAARSRDLFWRVSKGFIGRFSVVCEFWNCGV